MPLSESRQDSLQCISNSVDLFGGPKFSESVLELKKLEKSLDEMLFVILSDVHLDHPTIFEKLNLLFRGKLSFIGFSESPPLLFIFIGNFQSSPFVPNSECVTKYRGILKIMRIIRSARSINYLISLFGWQ